SSLFCQITTRPQRSTRFPYTTLFRSGVMLAIRIATMAWAAAQTALNFVLTANPIGLVIIAIGALVAAVVVAYRHSETFRSIVQTDRNSTRLNSSHVKISYAVFCLEKK